MNNLTLDELTHYLGVYSPDLSRQKMVERMADDLEAAAGALEDAEEEIETLKYQLSKKTAALTELDNQMELFNDLLGTVKQVGEDYMEALSEFKNVMQITQ